MEVKNVAGTTVNLNMTTHYINGTQALSTSTSVDLNSNTGMLGVPPLIAGNLKSGDPLEPSFQPNAPTINRTVTGIYAGASRNANVLDFTTVINFAVGGNQTVTIEVLLGSEPRDHG
jgi:hypothetical protein